MLQIDVYSSRAVIRSQEPLTVGMVGAKAHFRFSDLWKSLTKTVVFRQGDITKDIVGVTSVAVIPWEVLQEPGLPVQIGIYGSKDDGKVVIPTVWVETDLVFEGVDPMADTSTNPTLPVYQQLQEQMESYSKSLEALDNRLGEVEGDYLPKTGGTVTGNVRFESGDKIVKVSGDRVHFGDDDIGDGVDLAMTYDETDEPILETITTVSQKPARLVVGDAVQDTEAINRRILQTEIEENNAANEHYWIRNTTQGAAVGQLLAVKSVMNNGFVSEVETVDVPTGGGSGVHVGAEPPVDETVSLWVNPEGDAAWSDAAYYDETVTVEDAANSHTLNFPCPIADFYELHIHMTGSNAVSKLYMEAGGESTYLIDPRHGTNSGTHIYLTATHQRDTMGLDVQTADYSENAQPTIPYGTASIGNEAASLRLYSKDGGDDLLSGMEIRVWGVYKTQAWGVLKMKDPTGGWESIKCLTGGKGEKGDKGDPGIMAVASPTTLGGVKPVAKTEEMTQSVGVDAEGGLWTAALENAGQGGTGGGGATVLADFTAEEDLTDINIPLGEYVNAYNRGKEIILFFHITRASADTAETMGQITASIRHNQPSGSIIASCGFLSNEPIVPTHAASYIGYTTGSVHISSILENATTFGYRITTYQKQNQSSTYRAETMDIQPMTSGSYFHVSATHPFGKGSQFKVVVRG